MGQLEPFKKPWFVIWCFQVLLISNQMVNLISIVLLAIIRVSNLQIYNGNSLSNGPKGWIWTRFSPSNLVTNVWGIYGILTTKVGIHLKVLTFISLHFSRLGKTCLSLGTFSQPISLFMFWPWACLGEETRLELGQNWCTDEYWANTNSEDSASWLGLEKSHHSPLYNVLYAWEWGWHQNDKNSQGLPSGSFETTKLWISLLFKLITSLKMEFDSKDPKDNIVTLEKILSKVYYILESEWFEPSQVWITS
jgi:hypothetical protein